MSWIHGILCKTCKVRLRLKSLRSITSLRSGVAYSRNMESGKQAAPRAFLFDDGAVDCRTQPKYSLTPIADSLGNGHGRACARYKKRHKEKTTSSFISVTRLQRGKPSIARWRPAVQATQDRSKWLDKNTCMSWAKHPLRLRAIVCYMRPKVHMSLDWANGNALSHSNASISCGVPPEKQKRESKKAGHLRISILSPGLSAPVKRKFKTDIKKFIFYFFSWKMIWCVMSVSNLSSFGHISSSQKKNRPEHYMNSRLFHIP